MFLINRNFGLLWFGQLVSQLGDKAYNIAMVWWLFEKTASPLYVSLFFMASMLPELLFGPVAGVYIDRWNKKIILIAADFIRSGVVLTLATLYQANLLAVWHIFVAAVSISLCSALFNPATMSVIPMVVDTHQLQRANALSQLVAGAVAIIGPLFGAFGVSVLGYLGILTFNGCSYLISGIAESVLRLTASETGTPKSMISSLMNGFRFIRSDARVSVVVVVVAVIHIFFGSIVVILPFLAKQLAGSGIDNLGVLEAAIGGGLILGGGWVSRRERGVFSESFLFYAIMAMGLGIATLGLLRLLQVEFLAPYAIVCAIIGLCIAFVSVFWRTMAQTCVPEDMTGRVFSVLCTIGNISVPISIGIFGGLLNFASAAILLACAGLGLVVSGNVLLYKTRSVFAGYNA